METLYCQCGQRILCSFRKLFFLNRERLLLWCPNPNCTRRLHYRELHAQPPKRKPVFITTYSPVPTLFGRSKRPWHAPYLEVHLMGIARSLYRDCLLSDGFNRAAVIEWMYDRMGLVVRFGLN